MAWVIRRPRSLVETWIDQGVFYDHMVFRVDVGRGRPQIRFTENGIRRAINKVLSERIEYGPIYCSEDYFIEQLRDFTHMMFARLDRIR